MATPINAAAVAALAEEPLDWRFKGLPASWSGRTPADVCAERPDLFAAGAVGPICVLSAEALAHNLVTMARWCQDNGVELAPHGKTHMAPQLLLGQLNAGASAATAATISQVRVFRAFGVRDVVLANELVDETGLRWLAAELDGDPDFQFMCWVDSVRGVDLMTTALRDTDASRAVDVCVEVGMAGGRTGCRGPESVDKVAGWVAASPHLRLVGVAGYEAALGHDVTPEAVQGVASYLEEVRATVLRLASVFEVDRVIATAGGSTYFDLVTNVLSDWPDDLSVRTMLRSGCYLTHDDGLYQRTSPRRVDLRPALSVWAQVVSRPEPHLAVLTMGRRDVSFDQDLPVPYGLPSSRVRKLNDQHAYLVLGGDDRVEVGEWVQFGISHPCTVFDKWSMIPVLDDDGRVVDLIRTFF
jgi:D-serine deaminase-like pyridoxal phosphate-dependent protein